MNTIKTLLAALILPLLTANSVAMEVENEKFNQLILRDFKHEESKPTIKLLEKPKSHENSERKIYKIGYADNYCINELNQANLKANHNSPVVPFRIALRPRIDIQEVLKQQIRDEKEELTKILNAEMSNSNEPDNLKRRKIETKVDIFNKRIKLMYESANNLASLPTLPRPALIPIEYLHNKNNIQLNFYNKKPLELEFNEHQELEMLEQRFEKKPTTVFFCIPETMAVELNNTNEETPEEEADLIAMKILDHIKPQKTALKEQKIINRRAHQIENDLGKIANNTLPSSNIVTHVSNYYSHGDNGLRMNLLQNALQGQNPIAFLNNRQKSGNTRHLKTIRSLDSNIS